MAAEANRSADNLIVMCLFHASAIDEQHEEYPVEILRQWKEEAEEPDTGPGISDTDLASIEQHWTDQSIVLSAETITLGGNLGGGGGAIGPGAFGGRGGDIGQFPELRPRPRRTESSELPDEGAGHSHGFDGQPGGPSAIVSQDGEVRVAAGGGGGAFAGTGLRSTTTSLSISTLMFVNSADMRDGLCFVLGGAWQSLAVAEFPAQVQLCALGVFEAGGADEGEYTVRLELFDPSGQSLSMATFPLTVTVPGAVVRVPKVAVLGCDLASPGRYSLVASTESEELGSTELVVRQTEPDLPPDQQP